MTHEFDKGYWERHWGKGRAGDPGSMAGNPPNPYLERETGDLTPGTALDAGCGSGAEAIWLASHGWRVTATDISPKALAHAAEREAASGASKCVQWVEADLCDWNPGTQFDLVMTHYAHPAMPQLEFYARIAGWVAPGGTLLIVGHGQHRPAQASASATAEAITEQMDPEDWDVVTAEEIRDVVVRATRRPRAC